MAQVTATAHVFPSANDLIGGGAAGDGKNSYERNLSERWIRSLLFQNCMISGGALPSSDPDLTVQIPAGIAYIRGLYVSFNATNITFPASSTSHVWVRVLKDGSSNASSVVLEHNTTGTDPEAAYTTKIGTVTASASAVTSTVDQRTFAFIDQARLIKPCVGTPELKLSTGSATINDTSAGSIFSVALNRYAFAPAIYATSTQSLSGQSSDPGNTIPSVSIIGVNSGLLGARWDYVTSSDDPVIEVLLNATGELTGCWTSDDPLPEGIPGIRCQLQGYTSRKLKAVDLGGFNIPDEDLKKAEVLMEAKNLKGEHLRYRALQSYARDVAPSRWLLENGIFIGEELRLATPQERQQKAMK